MTLLLLAVPSAALILYLLRPRTRTAPYNGRIGR